MARRRKKGSENTFTGRLIMVFSLCAIGYLIIIARLFSLQVVNGEKYNVEFRASALRETAIPAPRGVIYDKYGIPLASTKMVYNVKYNQSDLEKSMSQKELNEVFLKIIKILNKNDRTVNDELPVSQDRPYKFLYESEASIKTWQKNILEYKEDEMELDAEKLMMRLYNMFEIDFPHESEEVLRQLCAIRYEIYAKRYYGYIPLDIASDVDTNIVIAIEERKDEFPRIYIEAEPVRYYNEGEAFTHILGYVGKIDEEEYKERENYGYDRNDIIGKVGIEKEMENYLRGMSGLKYVEVDVNGRTLTTKETLEPSSGNNIYLTIDSILQQKVYDILEKQLNQAIIDQMKGMTKGYSLSTKQVYDGLASGDAINLSSILKATSGAQLTLKEAMLSHIKDDETYRKCFSRIAKDGIISESAMISALVEQGRIKNIELLNGIRNGWSNFAIMVKALEVGDINADDLRLYPSTGSVVVQDIATGKVLALVNYPSYDANRLVGNFDQIYYSQLVYNEDRPMLNRALTQKKAPGSIYKMITAIAGLEEGFITKDSIIVDRGLFTAAGKPYAKCWKYPSNHGAINVAKALEVSCNYFFYDLSLRFGKTGGGIKNVNLKASNILTKYSEMFGLGDYSGIELGDSKPEISNAENKEKQVKLYNNDPDEYDLRWYDGDTIRSAIGQGYHVFAPIHISKYMTTLADGVRKTPFIINRIELKDEGEDIVTETKIEEKLNISDSTLKTVREGTLAVTSGGSGTASYVFSELDINVAGKTGTAQAGRNEPDFGWFSGYAPYENPQISITVMIPNATNTSHTTKVAKEVIEDYFEVTKSDADLYANDNVLTK